METQPQASVPSLVTDDGLMDDRSAILSTEDAEYEIVPVPEWGKGKKVRVRGLTSTERDAWEASLAVEKPDPTKRGKTKWVTDTTNLRAKLVVRCVVKSNGERVFQDGDVVHLGKKSAAAVDRIFTVAQKLSGLSDKDLEDLEGNSPSAPSSDSSAS